MTACPRSVCPRYLGQVCRCEPHPPPDDPLIRAEVAEPDDWARLERAGRRTNGIDHIPGVLPPGYTGISGEEETP